MVLTLYLPSPAISPWETLNRIEFPTRIRMIHKLRRVGITSINGKPLEECYASQLRETYLRLVKADKTDEERESPRKGGKK